MSDLKLQENQQELFSDFVPELRRPERIPSISKTQKPILVSTTTEQLILLGIVSILVCCLVFFLGMLRGRYFSSADFASKTYAITTKAPAPPKPVLASEPPKPAVLLTQVPILRVSKITPAVKKDNFFSSLSSSQKPYTIQVLTTKKKDYAERESAFLKKSGYYSWFASSADYYVVCVGAYLSRDEAKKDLAYFSSKYKSSYLRRK